MSSSGPSGAASGTSSGNMFDNLPREDVSRPASPSQDAAPSSPPRKKNKYAEMMDVDMSEFDDDTPEDEAMDITMEKTEPPKPRTHTQFIETVPDKFKHKEFHGRVDVKPFPDSIDGYDVTAIHKDYRGRDSPVFEKFKHGNQSCQVMFMDEKIDKASRVCQGNLSQGASAAAKFIKVSCHLDSQMPCLRLHIARPHSEKEVTYSIFANCIRPATGQGDARKPAGISLQYFMDKMEDQDVKDFEKYIARGHSNLAEFAKGQNLMAFKVSLYEPKHVDKRSYRCRPVFRGLPVTDLQRIRAGGSNPTKDADLQQFERTILLLDRARDLTIFRRIACGLSEERELFKNFFIGSMHLCSQYRNFWYYQLQTEQPNEKGDLSSSGNIFGRDCILEHMEPPRWMATKFIGYSSAQGAPITKVEPFNWGAFSAFTTFPSVQDCAFVVRLALARERNSQKHAIDCVEHSVASGCEASFEPVEGLQGVYTVKISNRGAAAGYVNELVKPEIDQRIKLRVEIPGGDSMQFEGHILDMANSAEVEGDQKNDFDFGAQIFGKDFDFGTDKYEIDLEFIDDTTTASRARNATENMARMNLKRDEGVDLRSVIFMTESTISAEKQDAGSKLGESLQKALERVEKNWRLNKKQVEAVRQTFTSPSGLALIHGPPGTGKTTTTTAAAHEHCHMGHKVIYTCPSNKAVDAAMTAFNKRKDSNIRAIRFVGGFQSFEKKKESAAPGTDSSQWESLANPTITAAMKANPDTVFHVKRQNAVKAWAAKKDHSMHDTATSLLDKLSKAKKLFGQKAKAISKEVKVLYEEITEYFLVNEVDIVFTTCSSACHPSLQAYFKPDVAFIDEAGQATIPDVCMALDPFKESVKWMTMSGDHKQLAPVVTAPTANEGVSILADSLFRQLLTDPSETFPHVMLVRQYRQHPDLCRWPNEEFYDGKLESDQSTEVLTPELRTVKNFFKQLGAGRKNDSRRMAIDVSGANAVSMPYGNTTSFCNSEEARIIVGLVKQLLMFEPNCSNEDKAAGKFAKVQPGSIGIITPYKGQQRLLRNMLMANGPDSIESKVVVQGSVSTTWGIQGSEIHFAFISLCVRNPDNALAKTKFISIPNALCVQNTRAQYYQVTTGNFKGWLEASMTAGSRIKSKPFKAFNSLARDFYIHEDIVSSRDIDATLLAGQAGKKLTESAFYKREITSLNAKDYNSNKRKAVGTSDPNYYQGDSRQPVKPKSVQNTNLGDLTTKMADTGISNRQKKKLAAQEKHRKAAEDKAAAEAAEQASGGKGKQPAGQSEPPKTKDWSEQVEDDIMKGVD